jgi:hypothetical protein
MPSAIGTGLFITVPLSCPSRPVESLKPCRSHVRSWLLLSAIQTTFLKIRVHFFSIPFGWCKKTIKKKKPNGCLSIHKILLFERLNKKKREICASEENVAEEE